jgi:hypothetical protein
LYILGFLTEKFWIGFVSTIGFGKFSANESTVFAMCVPKPSIKLGKSS